MSETRERGYPGVSKAMRRRIESTANRGPTEFEARLFKRQSTEAKKVLEEERAWSEHAGPLVTRTRMAQIRQVAKKVRAKAARA